ncbi:hypothetical protein PFISCL1PPCAC_21359, partial [Pristionchus fissidentatus]
RMLSADVSCKENLRISLLIAKSLEGDLRSPGEHLLNGMSAVLGAVVESDIGSSSLSRINDLYSTVAEVQAEFNDNYAGLAFAHFARAFATVMEESVRQL